MIHNALISFCQVYNYLEKTARVVLVFGPDLVILNPHENFNVLSLSGKFVLVICMHIHKKDTIN